MTERSNNTIDAAAKRTVAAFLRRISATYDVAEVIAFGSRARGDQRPDSDLDLAIILNGHHQDFIDTKLDMADRAFDVLLETGILVQALPLWKDDLAHPDQFHNPHLIQNITTEGVRVQ